MRYGLIADVHANLPALEAVLSRLDLAACETLLCAGDVVGYGPYPNECVAVLKSREAICVAGNHDLMAVGRLSDERASPLARRTLAWTRAMLSDTAREFLAALPTLAVIGDIFMTHGSLDDPEGRITQPRRAAVELGRMARADASARYLVVGNTHQALLVDETGGRLPIHAGAPIRLPARRRILVNPGSVGQSRERQPWARYAVLDTEKPALTLDAIDYDIGLVRRVLLGAGLPAGAAHQPPVHGRFGLRALRRWLRSGAIRHGPPG